MRGKGPFIGMKPCKRKGKIITVFASYIQRLARIFCSPGKTIKYALPSRKEILNFMIFIFNLVLPKSLEYGARGHINPPAAPPPLTMRLHTYANSKKVKSTFHALKKYGECRRCV